MKNFKLTSLVYTLLFLSFACSNSDDEEDKPVPTPVAPTNQSSFCYELTTTSVAYDTIDGGTKVLNPTNKDINTIPFEFPFIFCGQTFNKIFIASTFDPTFKYRDDGNIIDFRDYELIFAQSNEYEMQEKYGEMPGGNWGSLSTLKYKTTGTNGSRVMAIEWRNLELYFFNESYTFNFTMKFYEGTNTITYHYGPNDVTYQFSNDGFKHNIIGLYAILNEDGLFLKGDPNNPTTITRPNDFFGKLNGVSNWPDEGTLYTFKLK